MTTELTGVALICLLTFLTGIPLGRYAGKVLAGDKTWLDILFDPFDRMIYRFSGINPKAEMNWKQHLQALLGLNLIWFLVSMLVLTHMDILPLNPDGNPAMAGDLAFNTTVSFITNTNLQHYSGETGLSYFGQLTLMLWQFISAASGIAICTTVFYSMRENNGNKTGNFYVHLVRSVTRILLPLSAILAFILVIEGTPMTFLGKATQKTVEGISQEISLGPAAAMVAIKQLGTNGGGYYGANSANPMENPGYLSNLAECVSILLLPVAMIFAMGYILNRKKLAYTLFGIMLTGLILLLVPAIRFETEGNPALTQMRVLQEAGSMEGKEVRLGSAASATWAIFTTCTSNGSVNAMHDSLTPLTGMLAMLGMMTNVFFGGVGVGFLNLYVFLILSVFISGLMVGRTPEFLGKKIEAREMKIAMLIALLHPLLILTGTAISSHLYASSPETCSSWLANPGFHGFSEMLYEFTSSSANNGSGFEGLGDNTPFWNIACGLVMLAARYFPIIGPVALAASLASKQYIPESNGTLKTDTATFGVLVFAIISIVAALSFFPALTLGPIAEYVNQLPPLTK